MDKRFAKALSDVAASDPEEFKRYSAGPFLKLNKMAAARRQLNTAIWLWFQEGDSASIHTLTGAAFGILRDLYYREKKQQPAPFNADEMPEELREHAKNIRNLMTQTEGFLKHARTDPDATHALPAQFTEHYLFNAIKAYSEIKGECDQPLMSMFVIRFSARHPDVFGGSATVRPAFQEGWDIDTLKNLSRIEYFERFCGPDLRVPPDRHQF